MQKAYIYIDEIGTTSLNTEKDGTSLYMVYSAVVIAEQSITKARDILTNIIKSISPQRGYLKSKYLDYDKRVKVLTALKDLEHYVIALVIDKSKLDKDSGLQYKQSFIKYFQRLLSKQFFHRYDEFHIYFDKLGYPPFQKALREYMEQRGGIGKTLFDNNTFDLAEDTTEEPLLQLADIYAGTIYKYYCQQSDPNQTKHIHDDLLKGRVTLDWYPWETVTLIAAENIFSEKFDKELYDLSVATAKQYVEQHENGDIEGVELIKYILQESSLNPCRVISSKEIKQNLQSRGIDIGDPISKIASLRSKEVVIISPQGKKGYKFPTSEKELADFYDRLRDNVIPQLQRCQIINNVLQEKAFGKYGILKQKEYEILSRLCDVVGNKNVQMLF